MQIPAVDVRAQSLTTLAEPRFVVIGQHAAMLVDTTELADTYRGRGRSYASFAMHKNVSSHACTTWERGALITRWNDADRSCYDRNRIVSSGWFEEGDGGDDLEHDEDVSEENDT